MIAQGKFPHKWTLAEKGFLRRHYGPRAAEPLPTREIARVVGVSVGRVHHAAARMGATRPRKSLQQCEADFRRLHALGHSLQKIARALGVSPATASNWRARLGLPGNPVSAQERAAMGRRLRDRARRWTGTDSPGRLSQQRQRVKVMLATGWAGCRTMREARLLDALEAGPARLEVLLEADGGKRRSLTVVLRSMRLRGLVVKLAKWTYALADKVERNGGTHRCRTR